jgi:hypothetical protein
MDICHLPLLPTKFELVTNHQIAGLLGIEAPETLVAIAEVIE